MSFIECKNLTKVYKIKARKENFLANLFSSEVVYKNAIKETSLKINRGEFVGIIGSNGAGKSTLIKLLTGIMVPTEGTVTIDSKNPNKYRRLLAKDTGIVFGQRTQLWWNLPLIDSYKLLKQMYQISDESFNKSISIFTELLNIDKYLDTPVRQLSLGQRMQCEIVAAFLHNPRLVYLDEPTIGVDYKSKEKIREFLKEINNRFNTTIILTSHDMDDIEKLVERAIILQKGKIVYDGSLIDMLKNNGGSRRVIVEFETSNFDIAFSKSNILDIDGNKVCFNFDENKNLPNFLKQLYELNEVKDIVFKEASIEQTIDNIYRGSNEAS